ncbi:secreted RxLR effector protein 161-like [Solanum dulcamara]|uniref:secreted RxLR effector protein 161-like n=1 Tax=Solanum dulcamara TaxID=45834 RepID=UPI00248687B7|nr:secreted RxLR effector protein 161-like [Solanum dulcamara]
MPLSAEIGMRAAKPTGTPIDVNVKLTSREYDQYVKKMQEAADDPLIDQVSYQKLVGKLLYLNMTRPDISFSTQILSQFLSQPKKSHMEAALRVVRYLKKQSGQGILLSNNLGHKITAFCDADWAFCPLTRKSVTRYMIMIGKSLVLWKAKKKTTVSKSSTEAEYKSMASIVSELVWLLGMLN